MTTTPAMPLTLRLGARACILAVALVVAPLASAGLAAQSARNSSGPNPTQHVASGAIDDSPIREDREIDAAGRRYAGVVRNCYQEQGLKGDPTLAALLRLEMTVQPSGVVQAAAATATRVKGVGMPAVSECVSKAARHWRFSDGAPRAERVVLEFDLLPPTP
jgi:hypothetical protein